MTQNEKRTRFLKRFLNPNGDKNALIKDNLYYPGILNLFGFESDELKHTIEIFKQTNLILETNGKYELSDHGFHILKTGGFTPNFWNKTQRYFSKNENIWRVITPIITLLTGIIVGYFKFKC